MSHKTSDVFRAGDITVDGTLNSNESQLIFRPKQRPYNPYSGQYYSLSAAQIDDPTIRINQYAANGTFENFGYLYDTQFNPIPPGTRVSVAGGVGDPTQEPNPCIIYSYDNIHWDTWSNPTNLLAGGGCTALAYNGFIFAAGGSAGAANRMLYSANGSTWIASSSGTALCAGGCNNIATNGGFWIAGTQGANRLIFSFDGINWYAASATQGGADFYLTTSCNAAAWSGSLWLAGGNGDANIIRSTDGFFWQRSNNSNTIFAQCNAVAWNGTAWLAGGIPLVSGGSTIAISFDGDTWTPVPVTYPTTGTPVTSLSISCNAIGWSGAQWVIGGEDASGNTLAYSYDGTAWFPGTNSTFISCKAVSWNGNSWAAAGVGANSLVTSFSGAIWTPSVEGNRLLIEGGAVAVNKILPNATTVQQITVTATSSALTLVGASGETVIAFSKDGITWTPSTSASNAFPGAACLAFSWNGFTWAAGLTTTPTSPTYTIGNSSDGIVWGKNATGSSFLNISCNGITNNEAYWLAGGAGDTTRLIYSVDSNGITWADVSQSHTIFDASASNLVSQGICNTVGWNGLLWVAGSNCRNNRLAYSYDVSTNWTGSATGNAIFTTSCNSVAWNGLLWVAVGSAGSASVAAYSYDGITWTDISDADVKGARSWATVACNESIWIMGGRQVSGDCILFSYDGIHWSKALGTGGDFESGCTGVAWNGDVWVATGLGSNSVIYSYNGVAWVNSYNGDGIFPSGAQSVAPNRPQATTGATRPTPTLYAADIPSVGAVTYTPKDAALNSLYPSNTLFLDDIRRNVGINIVPTTHLDVGGSTITPVLDISSGGTGTGIYVESGNGTEPSLSLVNNTVGSRIARIEMVDRTNVAGWAIDDISTNHLQLTSWKNNQAFTVLDIAPGDTGAGQVDINGIDPLAPNGAALFVDGRGNENDLAINVLGNVNINGNDPSGAALYVDGMDNPADLALNVDGVTTLQETHATDVYLNKINPDGADVRVGTDTVNLILRTNQPSAAQLVGFPSMRFYRGGLGGYVEFDGTDFFPSPTNTLNLGSAGNHWNNLYVNQVNPTTFTPSPGSTRYATYDSSASGIAYLPDPGLAGTYSLYIQLVGGGGGASAGYGGGGGAFTGVAITGVAVGTRYDYVCGGGGDASTNGVTTSITFPSLSPSTYQANRGEGGAVGSGGAGGTAQALGGNIVGVSGGDYGTNLIGGLGGLAGATYLGEGGDPANGVGVAGYVSIDTVFVPTPITVNNDLSGATLLDQLLIKPGFGGGTGLLANSAQIVFGTNGSLNTGQYLYWNGSDLGPSLTNTTDLGAPGYRWDNLYVNNTYTNIINKDRNDLLIGNNATNGNLVVQTNGDTTRLIGYPYLDLKTGYGGSGIRIDGLNNPSSVVPITGDYPISLGSSAIPWSTLWANAINPGTVSEPDYVMESSTPGSGSYTLPEGFTYTVTVIAVGGGGGGIHWVNYTPVYSAGGGSGAYITGTKTGVPGGTLISWTIGAPGANNNAASPPTGIIRAGNGGTSQVTIPALLVGFVTEGGQGGAVSPAAAGGGGGGGRGSERATTVSGINGNSGGTGVDPPNTAAGAPSVYNGYGAGGDGFGTNATNGYVRIVATDTSGPAITYNLSSGPVYIDTLYVRNIVNL
jgi:hypothetical protein